MGQILADDVLEIVKRMRFKDEVVLDSKRVTLKLSIRHLGEGGGDIGKYPQRHGPDKVYEDSIARLAIKKESKDYQDAEIQVLKLGNTALLAVPAEYFVEYGLKIKLESPAENTYIVSCANGMIGYVPTREAFKYGGYETTLAQWSKLAPQAGDIITEAILELLLEMFSGKQ